MSIEYLLELAPVLHCSVQSLLGLDTSLAPDEEKVLSAYTERYLDEMKDLATRALSVFAKPSD